MGAVNHDTERLYGKPNRKTVGGAPRLDGIHAKEEMTRSGPSRGL
jgi:hypothetical protein